jgi:hypothetical protein
VTKAIGPSGRPVASCEKPHQPGGRGVRSSLTEMWFVAWAVVPTSHPCDPSFERHRLSVGVRSSLTEMWTLAWGFGCPGRPVASCEKPHQPGGRGVRSSLTEMWFVALEVAPT